MVGNLEGHIALAVARRKLRFDNSMPMATRFDPRLPNFRMPAPGSPRLPRTAVRPLPVDEADIAFASIGELAAWIGAGALTNRRLTEIYLSRIDAFGPRLECFATVTAKRALAEAEAADALDARRRQPRPTPWPSQWTEDRFNTEGITAGGAPSRTGIEFRLWTRPLCASCAWPAPCFWQSNRRGAGL